MSPEIQWWVQAIGLPLALVLFGLIMKIRSELHGRVSDLRDDMTELKLTVAKDYATQDLVKEYDQRIMNRLNDISHKLDGLLLRAIPAHGNHDRSDDSAR